MSTMDRSNQNVVAVYRDGTTRVFGHQNSRHVRPLIGTKRHAHYGAALAWAADYEAIEQAAAARRGR